MPLPKYAAHRDANEPEIVEALKAAGASVVPLSMPGVPDLLVGVYHADTDTETNYLLEVKSATGTLEETQIKFFKSWRGQAIIVRTVEEALRVIGAID